MPDRPALRCGAFRLGQDGPVQARNFHIRGLPGGMVLSERGTIAGMQEETDLGLPTSAGSAHPEALAHMFARLDALADPGMIAEFSHRSIHGGAKYAAQVLIDDTVLAQIKTQVPSHQPHNLRPIRQMQGHYPGIPVSRKSGVSTRHFTAPSRAMHRYSACHARWPMTTFCATGFTACPLTTSCTGCAAPILNWQQGGSSARSRGAGSACERWSPAWCCT